jgi:pimeloyl-ACP methyl ester carboxylesterase
MSRDLELPTVVIAHGAWVDATSWREVIALLQAKGLNVLAVQNPLSALADDIDAVTRTINHQPRPVVLVSHDYGGTIITQTGNHSSVVALVYIAAFAPDIGESTTGAQNAYPPPACVGRFQVDAGGFLYLAPDAVLEFLAHDLPATEGLVLAAAQCPIRASALLDRVTAAAWHTKPSWYAVTEEDRMMSPALQREIASRIKATVRTLRAGHVPFLSKPKETTDVILAAVDAARKIGHGGGSIAALGDRE